MEGLRYPVYRFAIMAAGLAVAAALYLAITTTRAGMLVRGPAPPTHPWSRRSASTSSACS